MAICTAIAHARAQPGGQILHESERADAVRSIGGEHHREFALTFCTRAQPGGQTSHESEQADAFAAWVENIIGIGATAVVLSAFGPMAAS